MAPAWAISGNSCGISRLACSSTISPSVVSAGRRRSFDSLVRSLAKAARCSLAVASVAGGRMHRDQPGRAVQHGLVAAPRRLGQPMGAEHRRNAQRAQHDRGMAIGPALLGRHPGDAGRFQQRGIGRRQFLGDQDAALRQVLEAAEGRRGQVADQPAADVADLVGAAGQPGLVVVLGGEDDGADLLRLLQHGGLGADQAGLDALARAADQPRIAQHHQMGIEQRLDLLLRLLGQHADARLELGHLLA